MPHGLAIEEPITNYFRRISSTRNNKQNSQPASTVKRKRPQTSQAEDAKEQKPRTRQKLAFPASSRNRSETSDARTRSSAPKQGSSSTTNRTATLHASRLAPSTPLSAGKVLVPSGMDSEHKGVSPNSEVKSSSAVRQPADGGNNSNKSVEARRNQHGSLQTPPPTIIPRRKFVKHVQPAPSAATTYPPSPCSGAVTTPVTIVRRIFLSGSERQEGVDVSTLSSSFSSTDPHSTHSHNHISKGGRGSGGSREKDHDQERDIDEDPFVDVAVSQTRVLSSQTQDLNLLPLESLVDPPVVPVFRLPLLPETSTSRRMSVVDCSDFDEFIHSSQTQHILPHHISPRRKFCDNNFLDHGRSLMDRSIAEEIIPSSQSQTETELNMSMHILDYFPRDKLDIRDRQPATSSRRNSLPSASCSVRRSSSDDPPAIPTQDSDDRTTDAISLAQVDSATEDESDDEPSIRNTRRSSSPRMPLSHNAVDADAVGNDNEGNEMPEETAEPVSSLPNTVQDFELMFGESSGSLPGDFPMSLQ